MNSMNAKCLNRRMLSRCSLLRLLSMQQRWRITTRRSKFMSRFATLLGKRWLYIFQAWLQSSENSFSLGRLQHLLLSPACWSTVQRSISLGYFSHIGHSLGVYMYETLFQGLPLSPVHRCIECSACCCQVRYLSLKSASFTTSATNDWSWILGMRSSIQPLGTAERPNWLRFTEFSSCTLYIPNSYRAPFYIWLTLPWTDIFSKSCHFFFNFSGCFWVLFALSHLPRLIFLVNHVRGSK